jgi:transglutaminase superfamily protein
MALMLRYLGIPARVAAGFNSGSYDKGSGEWIVTDHNAHEWVEVWFRGWGWVPFDPTPGRGGLAGAYSSSSKSFDAAAAAVVLSGKNGLKQFESRRPELGLPGDPLRLSADVPRQARPVRTAGSHGFGTPGIVELLLLVLAGVVLAIAAAKLIVRRSRYLTRDPRRLAAACHRELREILLDQRIAVPASATPAELAALAEFKLDVGVPTLGPQATVARFGPPPAARRAARELRRSMRAVRRGVRSELTGFERARGLVSLRSLGLA